jgi:hypothetical protein
LSAAQALTIDRRRRFQGSGDYFMSIDFLMGAILGSGIAIFAGRAPAYRLLAIVQRRVHQKRWR